MASYQPPPTYADVILVDPENKKPVKFNPIWLNWFLGLTQKLTPGGAGSGTVTDVSVITANGLAGSVANSATTPAITLSTTITGLLKGNGAAISAATSGTDYAPPTSGTSILYGNGSGGFYNVTIGTGVSFVAGTLSATGSGGNVVGPASSTDNAITRFDGTTGKLIQNSVTTIDDTGNASGILSQQFSDGTAVTLAAGKFWYNGTDGSWNAGMGNGNITQQIGEEIFVYGKASAAITDSPLQIVYKTGVVGASGVVKFAPAAAGITDPDQILGIATESLALNAFGRVTNFGIVHGITTNGTAFGEVWADNDDIWYNPTTGNPTKTKPSAPGIKIQIGTVINAGSGGSGSFFVKIGASSSLGGTDSNVQFGTLANNNLIAYDSTAGYWKNVTASSIGLGTVTSVGWTGGIVSVATATTTPAFTIAGTSGGVPYFSSTSTWATSAALAASAIVIGGGAGAAPSTTATGTGVVTALGVNTGSAGAFVVNGGALGTPSSGTVTNLTGTASININGTVGATSASTGAFTTLSGTTNLNLGSGGTTTNDTAHVILNGTLNTNRGAVIQFQNNSATYAYMGSISSVIGGGSVAQDLAIYSALNQYFYAGSGTATAVISSTGLAVTGTLSATSTLSTSDTTDSSSTTTGALKTAGGLGVEKTASLNILHEVTGEAWTAYTPTITVDTGTITSTVTIARYRLLGKTLFISLVVSWTVTSGIPSEVRITTPSSLLAQSSSMYMIANVQNNSVNVFGGLRPVSSSARMFVYVPGDAFVGSGAINGNFVIEVQ